LQGNRGRRVFVSRDATGIGIHAKVNYSGSGQKYAGSFERDRTVDYVVYASVNVTSTTNWIFRGECTGTGISGGPDSLIGMIGQPDAAYSAGGNFDLLGGFWPGGPLCFIDFEHFARFAEYWLETGTGLPADLYEDIDNEVNRHDLRVFVEQWLCYCPTDWPLK
jgi:hypothetical protein